MWRTSAPFSSISVAIVWRLAWRWQARAVVVERDRGAPAKAQQAVVGVVAVSAVGRVVGFGDGVAVGVVGQVDRQMRERIVAAVQLLAFVVVERGMADEVLVRIDDLFVRAVARRIEQVLGCAFGRARRGIVRSNRDLREPVAWIVGVGGRARAGGEWTVAFVLLVADCAVGLRVSNRIEKWAGRMRM